VNRFAWTEIDVLVEQAELKVIRLENIAAVGRFYASYEAENGRFPCPIPADEADLFARVDLERNTPKHFRAAVRFLCF